MSTKIKQENLIKLIESATSLDVVKEFLKAKKLPHSVSNWQEMREVRLPKYLDDGSLTTVDLLTLLVGAEECGAQHVFLYQIDKKRAGELMDRSRVAGLLKGRGLERLLQEADVQTMPETPTIVDVRWDVAGVDSALIIKEVEARTKRVFLGTEVKDDRFYKIYTNEPIRAVNVAKLHRDGFLEIRLQARNNTTKYDDDLRRFLRQIEDIIPWTEFQEVELDNAKDKMWIERQALADLIRYTDASVCDKEGNVVHAYTGSPKNNLSKSNAGKCVDLLMEEDDQAYCADSNLWFNKLDGQLSSDVHVLLNGDPNELALPAKCSATDYDYVLNKIRHFNR
jgi:hypothetical protein